MGVSPVGGRAHLLNLRESLGALERECPRLESWGRELAARLRRGARLLAAGNGGSAAQAQHLTAELVGRYVTERMPLSAIALHAETSSLTAIVNDYGPRHGFARQVLAHGRPGDRLLAISTSGRSENVLAAVEAARMAGVGVWALTGPVPNPLAEAADDHVGVPSPLTATIQEVHQVAIHIVCDAVDAALARHAAARVAAGA